MTRGSSSSSLLPTLGPAVCAFVERHCVLGEGDHFGEPFTLRRFQRRFLYRLYELVPVDPAQRHTPPASWPARGLPMRRRVRRALLGLPKGSGKTPLAAAAAAAELLGPVMFAGWSPSGRPLGRHRDSPVIPIGAASFKQADLVFDDLATMFRESPTLASHAEVFEAEIQLRHRPGRAYKVAAAAGTNDGARPSCLIADELHEWTGPKERVHLVLANGIAKRADGLVLNITTAGHDLDSLCGRLYTHGRRVAAGELDDDDLLFDWHEIAEGLDLDDPAVLRAAVRAASPAADDFLDVEAVAVRYHQIPRFEWERYHGNRWTRAEECWLPNGAWDACRDPDDVIDPAWPAWVGVDMALKHDSIAVVLVAAGPDGRLHTSPRVWDPDGVAIDIAAVEAHLRELHRRHDVREIGYDPAYFERSAQALLDEGLPMVEFPQSRARMVPACQNTYEAIVQRRITHAGEPTLTDHVLSAAQKPGDTGWTLSKGRSRRKIDACIALVMAVDRAVRDGDGPNPGVWDLAALLEDPDGDDPRADADEACGLWDLGQLLADDD